MLDLFGIRRRREEKRIATERKKLYEVSKPLRERLEKVLSTPDDEVKWVDAYHNLFLIGFPIWEQNPEISKYVPYAIHVRPGNEVYSFPDYDAEGWLNWPYSKAKQLEESFGGWDLFIEAAKSSGKTFQLEIFSLDALVYGNCVLKIPIGNRYVTFAKLAKNAMKTTLEKLNKLIE